MDENKAVRDAIISTLLKPKPKVDEKQSVVTPSLEQVLVERAAVEERDEMELSEARKAIIENSRVDLISKLLK